MKYYHGLVGTVASFALAACQVSASVQAGAGGLGGGGAGGADVCFSGSCFDALTQGGAPCDTTELGYYNDLQSCACDGPQLCIDECGDNFCNDDPATGACNDCLASACTSEQDACANP